MNQENHRDPVASESFEMLNNPGKPDLVTSDGILDQNYHKRLHTSVNLYDSDIVFCCKRSVTNGTILCKVAPVSEER